jgi:hypothetical protein
MFFFFNGSIFVNSMEFNSIESSSKCMIHLGKFDQPDEMIYDGKIWWIERLIWNFVIWVKSLQDDQYFLVHELEEQKAPSGFFLM